MAPDARRPARPPVRGEVGAGAWQENEAIWIFTLAEARITGIRAVSDRLGLFLQLGWEWPQAD
ncbi:hypothetical protein [Streptomyces sp. ISL-11]|uniref:hypothetical protein n=1 Tax=Streptomyces sp. ISL-11 TaxID=2819174 RepID=UPI0020354E74|nr:hypothetical protein [Streptomyces sp. ISL-11]